MSSAECELGAQGERGLDRRKTVQSGQVPERGRRDTGEKPGPWMTTCLLLLAVRTRLPLEDMKRQSPPPSNNVGNFQRSYVTVCHYCSESHPSISGTLLKNRPLFPAPTSSGAKHWVSDSEGGFKGSEHVHYKQAETLRDSGASPAV